MKIDKLAEVQVTQKNQGIQRNQHAKVQESFEGLLEKEMQSSQACGDKLHPALETADRMIIAKNHIASPAFFQSDSSLPQSAIGEIRQQLNRIDETLNRGGNALKAVEDAIVTLTRESDSLNEKLAELPDMHPLRQIGEELRVLAYVENVKWRRGDYF